MNYELNMISSGVSDVIDFIYYRHLIAKNLQFSIRFNVIINFRQRES